VPLAPTLTTSALHPLSADTQDGARQARAEWDQAHPFPLFRSPARIVSPVRNGPREPIIAAERHGSPTLVLVRHSLEEAVDELQRDFQSAMEAVLGAIRMKHGVTEQQMTAAMVANGDDPTTVAAIACLREVRSPTCNGSLCVGHVGWALTVAVLCHAFQPPLALRGRP
jgi:hypothetical protein